jgi:hypothetical protein
MKSGFALAGAAAAALVSAQPVMAGGTLSANSLPAAGVSVQPAASLGHTSRTGALRKSSRLGDAEGVFAINPLFLILGVVTTVVVSDALNIINFGLINKHVGPYGSVA